MKHTRMFLDSVSYTSDLKIRFMGESRGNKHKNITLVKQGNSKNDFSFSGNLLLCAHHIM